MIRIRDLYFSYPGGEFQLRLDSLDITARENVAVIGPSGSGKTTLLNLVAGITIPASGSVAVGDIDVSQLSDTARRAFRIQHIGFVFQDFELVEYLNVLDNILHPYRITSTLKLDSNVRDRALSLTEAMGIRDKTHRRPAELSQGERQRAAICRALITGPQLILADEATGNLDPNNKQLILDLLFQTAAEHDAALLAVTHDHELLPRFDRVLDFGELTGATA